MRKRLLLLPLALWPLLVHAEPRYGDYGFLLAAIQLVVMGVVSLVVAQVVGRVLRWLLGTRSSLWWLSAVALLGCWLGSLYQPGPIEPREQLPPNTVVVVSGDRTPPPAPPGPWFLTACSAGAVTLAVALAAWHAKRQWPEQD